MNRSTPDLPVHHQLLEFTQTHVHRVSDAIQPSHLLCLPLLLLPPIPPSIRVFSYESTLCMRWPKYWSFSFNLALTQNKMEAIGDFERSNYASYLTNLAIFPSDLTRFFLSFTDLWAALLSLPSVGCKCLENPGSVLLAFILSTWQCSGARGDSTNTSAGKNAFVFLCG